MKIVILIPVHNEVRTIANIIRQIKKRHIDVIVVDDGSNDNSGKLAEKEGAILLRNQTKSGKGASLRKGFAFILNQNYDGVLIMDGDGQHDVDDISLFLKHPKISTKCVITGNRMYDTKHIPFLRKYTNYFMSWLISKIARQVIQDTQCGFRFIGREVLKQISLNSNDFEIETEIILQAAKKDYSIYSTNIKTIYQNEVSKINPFFDTIRFIIYLIKELTQKKS